MKDFTKQIKEYYDVEIEALKRLDAEEISKAMNVIHQCYLDGGKHLYLWQWRQCGDRFSHGLRF